MESRGCRAGACIPALQRVGWGGGGASMIAN